MDITSEYKEYGRIILGLFGDKVPKTVNNFKTILTKGISGKTYAGTRIFKIIKKFVIQGKIKYSFILS